MKNRRRKWTAALAAAAIVSGGIVASTAPASAAVGVYVDPTDVRVANWEGWGTAMAWWADRVGTWPEAKRAEIADLMFSPTDGLGLNIVRYNLGGSADPNRVAAMRPGGAVPTYLQKDEATGATAYDWTQDAGQRQMLQMAKDRGANVFEAFVNSAPYWMTVSGDPRGSANCWGTDNLAPANYDAYVDYVVTVLKKFETSTSTVDGPGFGTDFHTISPYNEPDICWNNTGISEGSTLSSSAQSAILTKLDAALAAAGLDTQISGPETSNLNNLVPKWNALSTPAKNAIDQINVHAYGGSDRQGVFNTATANGKRLWMSEYGCCGFGQGPGDEHNTSWQGMSLAQTIVTDLEFMRPSAWVMWQTVEDESTQQQYGVSWGTTHADMAGSSYEYTNTKMFPFFRQFTNYVRPGSQIIGTGDPNVVASYSPATGKLALVAVNNTGSAANKTINLRGFASNGASATAVRTSGSESFASLPAIAISNRQLTTSLPAGSVTSFTLDVGAAVAPPWNAAATYEIVSAKSGQSLAISAASTANGAQVLQWPATNGNEQRWKVQPTDSGYFKIINANSTQALSIAGESAANGGNAVQWPYGGGWHQQWRIAPAPEGGYALINRKSGKLLSITGESVTAGASAVQWDDGSGSHQRWSIIVR